MTDSSENHSSETSTDAETPNDATSNESEDNTATYHVYGWAELAPSNAVTSSVDVTELPYDDQLEFLREDLRDRGFTDEQIAKMHLEIDFIEKETW